MSDQNTPKRDERICRICDGGPGNEGACLCGYEAWDEPKPSPVEQSVASQTVALGSTVDLTALLREFYTDAEAFVWITSPQPQFDGAVALDMIAAGRTAELVLSLRRVADGVYL